MLKSLRAVWHYMMNGEDENLIEHVPVSGSTSYRKKLAKARERHGKEFRAHTKVNRTEPPSRDLQELNDAGKPMIVVENAERDKAARVNVREMKKAAR